MYVSSLFWVVDAAVILYVVEEYTSTYCIADLPSIFEVEEIIKSMSNRKSVGPDELPAELLKLALDEDRDGTPHTGTVPCHCDRNMAGRGRTAEVERCHDYCFAQGEGPDGVR